MKKKSRILFYPLILVAALIMLSISCSKEENDENSTPTTVTDIDGNVYHTVTIGTQVWMAENLKTTKFRDGSPIPNVTENSSWIALGSPAYCYYNNDNNNKNTYGALYNYYAVIDSKNLCPTGWHVPTNEEWIVLENFLGGSSIAGGKMKAATLWNNPNIGADNSSGFTALPSGWRDDGTIDGGFYDLGSQFKWWSSSTYDLNQGWFGIIGVNSAEHYRDGNLKQNGYSIRCIKD